MGWVGLGGDQPVGRDDELRRLDDAHAGAMTGTRRAVHVTGPAGIGKSHLVRAAASRWAAGGCPVAWGTCRAPVDGGAAGATHGPSWAPVLEAWREIERVGGPPFAALLTALSGLGELPADVARGWLLDQVDRTLEHVASPRGLVLVVEDVHHADPATLQLLVHLAGGADGRLLLVTTARTAVTGVEPAVDPEVDPAAWAAPGPFVTAGLGEVLALGPLDDRSSADLVRAVVAGAGGRADPGQVTAVVRRAGGNPYYGRQLATALLSGARDLPGTLRRSLLERLRAAGPDVTTVVAAAALAPWQRDLDGVLDAVLGERSRAALRRALRTGVVLPADLPAAVGPEHPLLGEVAVDVLPQDRLVLVHRVLASAARDPQVAAEHLEAARDRQRALVAWLSAARGADRRGDHPAAGH
ncbi:AAA family ATPase, partial [Thalassiella azotivora]